MSDVSREIPEQIQQAIRETLLDAARFVERDGLTHFYRAIWCIQGAAWKRAAAAARYRDVVDTYFAPRSEAELIDCLVAAAVWED